MCIRDSHSGVPDVSAIESAIRADDIHYPPTSLICTEITHYRYGGIIPPLEKIAAIYTFAQKKGIPVHCDGARIFNAAVALNKEVSELTYYSDSVMVSLSKGLGAPVGSILVGQHDFIEKAKKYRKMLGGGMRQTGWLAACGIVALQKENIQPVSYTHLDVYKRQLLIVLMEQPVLLQWMYLMRCTGKPVSVPIILLKIILITT